MGALALAWSATAYAAPVRRGCHFEPVTQVQDAGPLFQSVFVRITASGVPERPALQMLARLREYVNARVVSGGRSSLSFELVGDAVAAAHAAGWSADDGGDLLVALQSRVDAWPTCDEVQRARETLGRVRGQESADDVLGRRGKLSLPHAAAIRP